MARRKWRDIFVFWQRKKRHDEQSVPCHLPRCRVQAHRHIYGKKLFFRPSILTKIEFSPAQLLPFTERKFSYHHSCNAVFLLGSLPTKMRRPHIDKQTIVMRPAASPHASSKCFFFLSFRGLALGLQDVDTRSSTWEACPIIKWWAKGV